MKENDNKYLRPGDVEPYCRLWCTRKAVRMLETNKEKFFVVVILKRKNIFIVAYIRKHMPLFSDFKCIYRIRHTFFSARVGMLTQAE